MLETSLIIAIHLQNPGLPIEERRNTFLAIYEGTYSDGFRDQSWMSTRAQCPSVERI